MTELAVLVPTRSRPHNLPLIVERWWKTGAFGAADLIFGVDMDDMRYNEYGHFAARHPEVKVIALPEWKPLVPKLNYMAQLASSEYPYVAFMGDDHVPRAEQWAQNLIWNHRANPGTIWYGPDGFQNERIPTWWSMDSLIVQKLDGRMVPAPVQHQYCDNAVKELGNRIGKLNYDQRLFIEHMHPFAGKSQVDAQYERVNRQQQYDRDSLAFQAWLRDGLEQDARLLTA